MNRFKAAGIHLIISLVIVITVLTIMYLLWYPGEYFTLMGGKTLIMIIASVDVFIGPLLTFAVYKVGKKSLKFDLFCIGFVQIIALTYGIYVMFQSRPVFTVFNKTQFQISAVVDITDGELAKGRQAHWKRFSIAGPELVAIHTPNKKNKYEYIFAMTESDMAYRYPRLYDDYNLHKPEVIKAGKPLSGLYKDNLANKAAVDHFVKKIQRPESDFLYVPISSELTSMSAIVDANTGDFIQIIDVLPTIVKKDSANKPQ